MNYPIGFVVALTREAQTLSKGVKPSTQVVELNSKAKLMISGMGYENAYQASEILIKSGCKHLISWGSCAALSPELMIGDVIIPSTIIDSNNQTIHLSSENLPSKIMQYQFIKTGLDYTHLDAVLCSKTEKIKFNNKTGAVAGDMESLAMVKVAKQHNIKCNIIRAVSDSTNTIIPHKVTRHINQYGDLIFPDFYKALLLNPFSIAQLIQLGKSFNLAMTNLNSIRYELY